MSVSNGVTKAFVGAIGEDVFISVLIESGKERNATDFSRCTKYLLREYRLYPIRINYTGIRTSNNCYKLLKMLISVKSYVLV